MTPRPAVTDALKAQQDLSAVERFSEAHEAGALPHQEKYYKALLPAGPPGAGQQYAFEVDLDRCSGCKACVTACHNLNGLDEDETWRSVGLLLGKKDLNEPAEKSGRLMARPTADVDTASLTAPRFYHQNVTTACHHCADPACLNGCPVNAYEKNAVTGIVKHLDDQCIGCQYCTYKCPYGVPQYNPRRGIVRKCDMCSDRLSSGEAPACVQACPNEAIRITLVETAATPDFKVPSAPDPSYTRPTTRYKTTRGFPADVRAQDHALIKPQHPEYPLVFMLVLTQAAVGAFALLPFLSGPAVRWGSASATTAGLLGLALATLHLGRPLYAFRVVVGLRRSWLSREAVVFGLFAQLALAGTALAWMPFLKAHFPPAWLGNALLLKGTPFFMTHVSPLLSRLENPLLLKGLFAAAALSGFLGVHCSAMIYVDTPREWWASRDTLWKFYLTAGSLGPAVLALAGARVPLFFAVALASGIAKGVVESRVLKHRQNLSLTALRKTALLLSGPFKSLFQRRAFLGAASLAFVGAGIFLDNGFLVLAGALMRFTGEFMERHLFFVAVAPPQMPGTL